MNPYLQCNCSERRDMWRLRGRGVIGQHIMVPNLFANSKLADMTILAISIAGIQAAYAIDTEANGNLSKLLFMLYIIFILFYSIVCMTCLLYIHWFTFSLFHLLYFFFFLS